jgi:hypothetical protein
LRQVGWTGTSSRFVEGLLGSIEHPFSRVDGNMSMLATPNV